MSALEKLQDRRPLNALLVGVLATLPACAGDGDSGSKAPPSERQASDAPTQDLTARPRRRGRIVGGEKVRRAVTWPVEADVDQTALAALPSEFRAAVPSSPVPVLAPVGGLTANAKLFTGDHWAATTSRTEDVIVSLNASGQARVYPHIANKAPMPHRVRGFDALVTQNEGIWSASWVERGVAYDLSVECVEHDASECQDDQYVTQLAEALVLVGGKEVR